MFQTTNQQHSALGPHWRPEIYGCFWLSLSMIVPNMSLFSWWSAFFPLYSPCCFGTMAGSQADKPPSAYSYGLKYHQVSSLYPPFSKAMFQLFRSSSWLHHRVNRGLVSPKLFDHNANQQLAKGSTAVICYDHRDSKNDLTCDASAAFLHFAWITH